AARRWGGGSSRGGPAHAHVAADGLSAHLDDVLAVGRPVAGLELGAHVAAEGAEVEPDGRARDDRDIDVAGDGVDVQRAGCDPADLEVARDGLDLDRRVRLAHLDVAGDALRLHRPVGAGDAEVAGGRPDLDAAAGAPDADVAARGVDVHVAVDVLCRDVAGGRLHLERAEAAAAGDVGGRAAHLDLRACGAADLDRVLGAPAQEAPALRRLDAEVGPVERDHELVERVAGWAVAGIDLDDGLVRLDRIDLDPAGGDAEVDRDRLRRRVALDHRSTPFGDVMRGRRTGRRSPWSGSSSGQETCPNGRWTV